MIARILPPHMSLISEVADNLVCEGKDYSANLVIFPGKRPAHFLRKELGRRLQSAYVPPQILSMDSFIEKSYSRLCSDDVINTLDAVAHLYEIHLSFEKRLGSATFTSLDLFFPVGLQLFRDIEELIIEMVPTEKVRDLGPAVDIVIPSASSDRMANLASYAERFYDSLRQSGKSTRAMRYCEVARRINETDPGNFERIIFAGFFSFTAAERVMLANLRELESLICLFQDGPSLDDRLSVLNIKPDRVISDNHEPRISFLSCPDIHGEVCALGDMIGKLREKNDEINENTAIVLPSAETLFPLLRHALAGWEEHDFNVTLGYPLARTPIFGFFRTLAELITSMDGERVYVPAYLSFVLHPYTKNIYFNGSAEATRILFHTIEEEWNAKTSPSFVLADSFGSNLNILKKAAERIRSEGYEISESELGAHLGEIYRQTLKPFLNIESIADFAEKSIALIEYIHDHSTARLHPLFYPYVETIIRALGDVRASALGVKAFSDVNGYFSFFERYLSTCSVPFEGTPLRGLQVLGVLETRALRFQRLYLLDANDDVLPGFGKNDSFLPARAREMLGLPTHRDRDKMSRYYFSTMIGGADEVTIVFLENDRKEKSRFVERLLWQQEQRTGKILGADAYPNLQYRVHLGTSSPEAVEKTAEVISILREREFSASALDRYLRCPLSFYYQDVLGLRQRDENSGEIERSDIGIIVHDALRAFLRELSGQKLSARNVKDERVSALTDNLFSRRFGERPFGPAYLMMRQVQRRLASFITGYLLPLSEGHEVTVLSAEETLKMKFHDFALAGRPDAIFKIDGRHVIMDFKTSAIKKSYSVAFDKLILDERQSWNNAVGSLQLPLYRILYANYKGMQAADIDATYLMLGMTHIDNRIELPLFGRNDDIPSCSKLLEELLRRMLMEIVDASVPFFPPHEPERDCIFCDYRVICGTQWVAR